MPRKREPELKDYAIITLAMLMGSLDLTVFLLPNHIGVGGITGIPSIIYWGFEIPVEVTYLVINATLLAFALKILGRRLYVKTIYAVLTFAMFVWLIRQVTYDEVIINDQLFMVAILGVVLMGSSTGMGLPSNGSAGGTDVIAVMINKYHDISLGRVVLLCDITIIMSSYLVLHDREQVLYSYVMLIVSSAYMDKVVNMNRRSVQFFIISEKYEEIGKAINTTVQRGCTTLAGNGFYSGRDMKMFFVLARQTESSMIFKTIDETDPEAFVSQGAIIGVYGLGFDRFKVNKKRKSPQAA